MLNARNGSRPRNLKSRRLELETLEDRHLLAGDLLSAFDVGHAPISDPFAFNAVTVEQMVQRAKTVPYVEGELVVATELPVADPQVDQFVASLDWNQMLGTEVESFRTMMSFDDAPGSSIALVHLDLAGADVIDTMRSLEGQSGVLWSAPNFYSSLEDPRELIPNDPSFGSQYHHPLMNNIDAWDITLGDSSIIIGVTDDGVDIDHADLIDNIYVNTGEIANDGVDNDNNGYTDDVNGWDFVFNNNNPNPNSGGNDHGTHVAGIAAAGTNNGIGVAGTAGNASILPLQFFASGQSWTAANINEAFTYGTDNGAHIINTSYNMNGWVGDPTVTAGFQYMHDNGVLHFNSAGNGNEDNPARIAFEQTLLTVNTDANDRRSSSSNYGTGTDISAPGSSVLSTILNNGYGTKSGTSMAAPNAAGVAALIWSQNPTWNHFQVAAQLLGTADDIDGLNPGFEGKLGAGRVNSFNALTQTLAAPTAELIGVPANGSSIAVAESISGFQVEFSHVMDPAAINSTATFDLRSPGIDGVYDTADDTVYDITLPDEYQVSTNQFDVEFTNGVLGIGEYRLSIVSGGAQNPFATPLDGNGDGVGGDDLQTFFNVSIQPFVRMEPNGSLVYISENNSGSLSNAADQNQFPFFAEQGELISAVITPNASAAITAEVVGVSTPVTGAPGQPVVIPVSPATASGQQQLLISADGSTTFEFTIVRGGNVEGLIEDPAAVAIDDSYLSLGSGRFATVARANGSVGGVAFSQYNNASLFVDIAGTGTPLNLGDDGEATVTTTVGNAFFASGVNTIGNNGAIVSGGGVNIDYNNEPLPTSDFSAGLFPFWDDIDSDRGNVYWEERLVNGINTLIVQWDNRPHFSNVGSATFQLQVFESGPVGVRYVYEDVVFGDSDYDFGASATIGIQRAPGNADQFSFEQPVLSDGDVIDIATTNPSVDRDDFTMDLTAYVGESIDVLLAGQQFSMAGGTLELFDPGGNPVATGSASPLGPVAQNYDLGILGYQVTTGGVYRVSVSAGLTSNYALVVAEDLVFDTESNDSTTDFLRSLDGSSGAIGAASAASDGEDHYELTLAAGQSITLVTDTLLDAAAQFPNNDLDPALAVKDAAGNVLASDDNSAADGKNAQLTFVAPAAGTYLVSVSAVDGEGEYLLDTLAEVADGDFNDDGLWNCDDINALTAAVVGGAHPSAFDMTGDGLVNLNDRDAWLAEAGEINLGPGKVYLLGDADLNGVVDGADFLVWNNNKFQAVNGYCLADFNMDGFVDGADFVTWNDNKFTTSDAVLSVDNDAKALRVQAPVGTTAELPPTSQSPKLRQHATDAVFRRAARGHQVTPEQLFGHEWHK